MSMFELPDQAKEIQAAAREFAREVVLPGAMKRDLSHEFPAEIVEQMAENGFMGMFIPEEYGGSGFTVLVYVVALEEFCYAGWCRCHHEVNNSLISGQSKFGNEEQKQKYLVPLASGEN